MAPEAGFILVFSSHPIDDEAVKRVHDLAALLLRIWEIPGSDLDYFGKIFIVFFIPSRRMSGYTSNWPTIAVSTSFSINIRYCIGRAKL
jgi:hypothetical protein